MNFVMPRQLKTSLYLAARGGRQLPETSWIYSFLSYPHCLRPLLHAPFFLFFRPNFAHLLKVNLRANMNVFELQTSEFAARHIGPNEQETKKMLRIIGMDSLDALIDKTIPSTIRDRRPLDLAKPVSEQTYLAELRQAANRNKVFKTYIGQGYYGTITPSVIARNLFENPGWYSQYTPYQAEIAQGRLESLLNFQTMVSDLTALPITNASLLDEGTAAAEAMTMFFHHRNKGQEQLIAPKFFVDEAVFAQTRDILITRAKPVGIEIVFGDASNAVLDGTYFGALIQYPNSEGAIFDHRSFIAKVHGI